MDDLISRQAAIDVIKAISNLDEKTKGGIIATFSLLDSAQPERKTGRWILLEEGIEVSRYGCSVCGRSVRDDTGYDVYKDYPFCHCGAKMRKDGKG